jgi:hypothetical protein
MGDSRPIGTKQAKRQRSEDAENEKAKEIARSSLLQASAERNRALTEQTDAMKQQAAAMRRQSEAFEEQNAIRLFSIKDEDIPPSSEEFFTLLKAKKLAQLRSMAEGL